MTISEIALLVSIMGFAFSVFFNNKSKQHTDTKDIEEKVATQTRMEVKLDDIAVTTKDIQAEVKRLNTDINEHSKKIVELESSLKSIHKRIDRDEKLVVERLGLILNDEQDS